MSYTGLFLGLTSGIIVVSVIVLFSIPLRYNPEEQRALCDRAVKALLVSPDLVEVTRAGIIVRELNCDIGRRHEIETNHLPMNALAHHWARKALAKATGGEL